MWRHPRPVSGRYKAKPAFCLRSSVLLESILNLVFRTLKTFYPRQELKEANAQLAMDKDKYEAEAKAKKQQRITDVS